MDNPAGGAERAAGSRHGPSGTTLSGAYLFSFTGFDRMAVSYDPVDHVAAATPATHF